MLLFSILFFANLIVIILSHNGYLINGLGAKIYEKFIFNEEKNFPTFFSTILLFLPASILFLIFLIKKDDKLKYYWLFLSMIFLFLSMDENISFHESFSRIMISFGIGGTGIFKFAWIIPYGIFSIIGLIILFKFLTSLPNEFRIGFLFSGFIYVCGAIVLESLSGEIVIHFGRGHIYYFLMTTLEESFEMIGLIIFINYLIRYIKFTSNSIQLNF